MSAVHRKRGFSGYSSDSRKRARVEALTKAAKDLKLWLSAIPGIKISLNVAVEAVITGAPLNEDALKIFEVPIQCPNEAIGNFFVF